MIQILNKDISAMKINGKEVTEVYYNGNLVWSSQYDGPIFLNTFGTPNGWQIYNNDITIEEV